MNEQAGGLSGEQLGQLRRVLHSQILTPDDAEYGQARHVWNGMIDRKPLVIVRPTSIADVIQSVRFAREHGLPASVRGGGHSVAGAQKNTHTSQFDGLLTVGQFKRVFIDHTDHVAVLDPL